MSDSEIQKTRIVDQIGLTLTPHSTLFSVQSDTIVLNAHSLVKYRKISQNYQLINSVQLGKGDQVAVCATIFKSQRYIAVALCGRTSTDIVFVSTQSLAIESTFEMQHSLQISSMCVSNNERTLMFSTRVNAGLFFVKIADIMQPLLAFAISDILPADVPNQPRYIQALGDKNFVVEIGLRGYLIHCFEEAEGRFVARSQLIEQLSAKSSCEIVTYKSQDFLLSGTADMRVELVKIDQSEYAVNYNQSLDPFYPYNSKFSNVTDLSALCDFQTFSLNQQNFSSSVQFQVVFRTEITKLLPTDSQVPKYGICGFKQYEQKVFCALRGGLILQFKLTTPTQQVVYEGEVYMDSDEDEVAVETKGDKTVELRPILELVWTANLDVDELILQNVSSSSPGSVLAQASAGQEESQAWSDARAQLEVHNLIFGNGLIQTLLYDPVGNQVYVVAVEINEKITESYTLLQPVQQICCSFVSLFTLIYLQNVPAAQPLLQLLQSQLASKLAAKQKRHISFLSLESGSLNPAADSQLLAGHVPQIINQDQKIPLHFKLSNTVFCWAAKRLATATTDGSVYVFQIQDAGQLQVVSSCKLLDSIQSLAFNQLGTQVVVACTDSIRVLVQNGKFLITQQQLPHKMAQIVKYAPSGANFVVGVGKDAFLYDAVTLQKAADLSGHNEQIVDICYLTSGKVRDVYLCTGAEDGMIYLWNRYGQRQGEVIGRFKLSSLSQFYCNSNAFDNALPYVLVAGDGLIHICTFQQNIQNQIVYKGSVIDDEGSYVNIKTVQFDLHRGQIIIGDSRGRIFSVNTPPPDQIKKIQDKTETKSMIKSTLQLVTQRLVAEQYAKQEVIRSPEQLVLLKQAKSLEIHFSPDFHYMAISGLQSAGLVLIEYLDGQHTCILRFLKESVDNEAAHSEYAFVDKSVLIDGRLFNIYQKQYQQLSQRVMEIQLEFEHTTKVEQQRHQKALDQQNSQAIQDVNDAKNVTEQFKNSAEKEIAQCENELMQLDRAHSSNLQTIELQYREKVQHIENQKQQLVRLISEMKEQHKNNLEYLHDDHEATFSKSKSDYDSEINNLKGQLESIIQSTKDFLKESDEMQNTADEDADTQLVEQQNKQNALLQEKLVCMDNISAASGMIRNKFTVISNSTSTFKTNIQACDTTLKTLESALSDLTKELELAKNEEKERQQSIIEREKHIYELKRQAKELEKHRFVLDYKIKDLRKLIQPREQEIHDLQEQVKEVGSELENYNKAITQMNLENQNLKSTESHLGKDLDAAKNNCRLTKLRLHTLEHEVASIIERHGRMTYYDLRKECEMLTQYGGVMKVDGEQQKADLEKTLHKQFLFTAAKELSEQLKLGKNDVVAENARIIEENTELLKEAAVLRREIQKIIHAPVSQLNTENSKVFQARITAQEAEIKRLQKRIKELEEMEA